MTSWNEEYGDGALQMPRLLWARVSIEPGREAARLVVEEWEIPPDDLYWTFVEAFAVEHSQSLRSLASPLWCPPTRCFSSFRTS